MCCVFLCSTLCVNILWYVSRVLLITFYVGLRIRLIDCYNLQAKGFYWWMAHVTRHSSNVPEQKTYVTEGVKLVPDPKNSQNKSDKLEYGEVLLLQCAGVA